MGTAQKEQVGQHLVTGLAGPEIDEDFVSLVRDFQIGNVILFRRNILGEEQLRRLCGQIQELIHQETGHDAFICLDEEGGIVTRLPDELCGMPGAMAIAATQDPDNAKEAAARTARQLKRCGVNVNFAPVLDVNSNPSNPVIGVRSFSDDPKTAASFGTAAVTGYGQENFLCVGKHFPGHGDTAVDSHLGLPVICRTEEELERTELIPFRAAVSAGLPAVMTSHILFPALEEERVPCTMSRRLITGLLKERMGFSGLVFSDCMEMDAIARYYGTARGAVAAARAGVALILVTHTPERMRQSAEELIRALEDGSLDAAEWEAGTEKILAFKEKYGKTDSCVPADPQEDLAAFTARLRRASVTLVKGEMKPLGPAPFFAGPPDHRAAKVSDDPDGKDTFPGYMAARLGGTACVTGLSPGPEEVEACVRAAKASAPSGIVVCTCNAHLLPGQFELVNALARTGVPLTVVAMKDPYDLSHLPENVTGIAAWDYHAQTLEVLADLFEKGETPAGRLPVHL